MSFANEVEGLETHLRLLLLAAALGPRFGSENLSLLLYTIVRMTKPETVVELGSGLGVSALWLAHAVRMNSRGHVYTVDDLELHRQDPGYLPAVADSLERLGFEGIDASGPREYFASVSAALGVEERLTLVPRRMRLEEPDHFADYPFAGSPIDLLFSDFRHGPEDIVRLLTHFLPRMASRSSILIDSVPSNAKAYLLLEDLVQQLNSAAPTRPLRSLLSAAAIDAVADRRIRVLHLTESGRTVQNTTTWLQIEPEEPLPPTARATEEEGSGTRGAPERHRSQA